MPGIAEFCTELLAWLTLAVALGLPGLALFVCFGRGRRLLSPQRFRAVPWTGLEVATALFLVIILGPQLFFTGLRKGGFFSWFYGPGFHFDAATTEPDGARMILWSEALSFPFQVGSVLTLFRLVSNTRPYQLGLTTARAGANVALGFLGWLAVAPLVLGINYLVNLFHQEVLNLHQEEHPVTQLARTLGLGADWALIVLVPIVAAPVVEELLFRGVLQTWLSRRPWGGLGAMAAAMALALLERGPGIQGALHPLDLRTLGEELAPAAFVLTMAPGFVMAGNFGLRWLPNPQSAQAIYGTALFFAAAHSSVWPTPIPLFVLGLALGFLAFRTQSLIGPIVMHSLFNAVAVLTLVFTQVLVPPASPNGKVVTSAGRRCSPASISSRVPGSWLPRRT